mmetsp:Transcript_64158/g.133793  ORF Transcript_64158/g.133793 Transcript_64158/m.133793 type:complete len:339 (-) Transcript_64158:617-1633(-)
MRTHFRLYNECEPCPENPGLLIAMFFLGAIALLVGGYVLSRKRLNLAFISIGVDYFQVLAIFASSKIAWPPYIERVFEIFSIFNFNIDITAPECLAPEFSYELKWWFTMALPLAVAAVLLCIHGGYSLVKLVRYGAQSSFTSHLSKLIGIYITLFYFLYLAVTKRALDVLNCNAVDPDDGYLYATFTSLECDGGGLCRCGEEGGVQQGLVPAAIVALCVYSLGFRPQLFPDNVSLRLQVPQDSRASAWCSFDGRNAMALKKGWSVTVSTSKWPLPIVTRVGMDYDWFNGVTECLNWNNRKAQVGFQRPNSGSNNLEAAAAAAGGAGVAQALKGGVSAL